MATLTQETCFDLAKSELITLTEIQDHVLSCSSGELWITVEGDSQDIILAPGQQWQATSRRPVVISALKASALNVAYREDFTPRRPGTGSMLVSLLNLKFPPLAEFSSTLIR